MGAIASRCERQVSGLFSGHLSCRLDLLPNAIQAGGKSKMYIVSLGVLAPYRGYGIGGLSKSTRSAIESEKGKRQLISLMLRIEAPSKSPGWCRQGHKHRRSIPACSSEEREGVDSRGFILVSRTPFFTGEQRRGDRILQKVWVRGDVGGIVKARI